MKPFKTLEEQIEILKLRNLIITDEDKAKQYLLEYSYYEVINVYSKFFQHKVNQYANSATFDEIRAVHIFDQELKSTIFKAVIECEKHFKATVAYRFSEYFIDVPFAYLKTSSYRADNLLNLTTTISILSKTITANLRSSKSNAIKHYYNNHNDVPLWVLVSQLTFGQTLYLYKQFDQKLKNIISKDISKYLESNLGIHVIVEPKELEDILNNLVDMRNCVAHNNKLFHLKSSKHVKYVNEIHLNFKIQKNSPRNDVFNNIIAMQFCLEKSQYAIMYNTILKRAKRLNNKLSSISIDNILDSMGFPSEWTTTAKRIEQ